MTVQEYLEKHIASILKLSVTQIEEIFQNPSEYAFDVEAEKFYKRSEAQYKTATNFADFDAAIRDGWKFDKVLNFGEYPTKFQVRKRNYLEPESDALIGDEKSFAEKRANFNHSIPRRPFD